MSWIDGSEVRLVSSIATNSSQRQMLINLSNHPLSAWSDAQRQTAQEEFGLLVDLPFPAVSADATLQEVGQKVEEYIPLCRGMFDDYFQTAGIADKTRNAIHIMGEFTFVYAFVNRCRELGLICVASTTERVVSNNPDNSKTTYFNFVQFRPYF
ncbi:MAG: hypothetical protein JRN15_14285 [Nitrososphaerota archaeon]|nr:hypothetical protein [Nitrososphaerota archaeon]